MKKIFAAIVAGAFLFTAVPVITGTTETVYAAKGGARIAPRSAPKAAPAPKSNAVESAPKTGPNQKDYAPSKSAKDLNKEAPKTNSASPAANAANSATGGMGNMMRNIGLFAGGMLLGGLIGNMLGMGGMGEIFGILANVILVIFAFMAIRWLWRKFKNRNNENPYQNNYSNNNTNIEIPPIKNVTPPEDGYNAKTMANRYRNR